MTINVDDIKRVTTYSRRSYDIHGNLRIRTVVFKRIEIIDLYDDLVRSIKSGWVSVKDCRVQNLLGILKSSLVQEKYDEVKGHLDYLTMKGGR